MAVRLPYVSYSSRRTLLVPLPFWPLAIEGSVVMRSLYWKLLLECQVYAYDVVAPPVSPVPL